MHVPFQGLNYHDFGKKVAIISIDQLSLKEMIMPPSLYNVHTYELMKATK